MLIYITKFSIIEVYGLVVQWLERRTYIPVVGGSNPSQSTKTMEIETCTRYTLRRIAVTAAQPKIY